MSNGFVPYLFLALAIVSEVIGSTFLQKSEQFTKLGPSAAVLIFFASAFYFLSLALKTLPLGIAYGIWAGLGMVLTAIAGYVVFKQRLDLPAMIGIGFIIVGVIVIQVFSKTASHS